MDQNQMIDDLVSMLDESITQGMGHVNVRVDDKLMEPKQIRTIGCTDCSKIPLACSSPTLMEGLDDQ